MPATERHCIDRLRFELDFASTDAASDLQERVADFAHGRAMRVIDEVFKLCAPEQQTWRLEQLCIDLGEVHEDDMESLWESRLKERLEQQLMAQMTLAELRPRQGAGAPGEDRHGADAPALRLDRKQAQLETLLYFLIHGSLPWHAPRHAALASPMEQLAHEVLRDSGAELVAHWRASPHANTMLQRAARQFPAAWLARVAQALSRSPGADAMAQWGADAADWVNGFSTLWQLSRLPSAPPLHLLWQGLLQALWLEPSALTRSQPLQAMLDAVAPAPEEQVRLWTALQTTARRAQDHSLPESNAGLSDSLLRACLAAPTTLSTEHAFRSGQPVVESRQQALSRLHHSLKSWLHPDAKDTDATLWQQLLHTEPAWLREQLPSLGRSLSARRRLAQALPESVLSAILSLWLGPTELALVQATHTHGQLWGQGSSATPNELRWQFSLSHVLLHPSPSQFQATEYLNDVLRQRSEHEGRPVDQLLTEMAQQQHTLRLGGRLPEPVVGVPPGATISTWLATRLPPPLSEPMLRLHRRQRLSDALAQARLSGVESDWDDAHRDDALWLRAVVRQHLVRPDLLRRAAHHWPEPKRQALVGLWLPANELRMLLPKLHDPALLQRLGGTNQQSTGLLWEDLIRHLMQMTAGTFFNVDAYLRGRNERLAPSTPASTQPDSAQQQDHEQDTAPLDLVIRILLRQDLLSSSDRARFAQNMHRLLQANVHEHRQALQRALESPLAARRLVALQEESQLQRLLTWLRPADHALITRTTQQLLHSSREDSAPNAEPGPRLGKRSWQFVLRELFEEGRRFDPVGYAVRLSHHLLRAIQPANPRSWLGRLAKRLLDASSSDHTREMADAIAHSAPDTSPVTPKMPPPVSPSGPLQQPASPVDEMVFMLDNAGLVLAGAFMQRLFNLQQLTDDKAFRSTEAAERGAHLLGYITHPGGDRSEPLMVLNKLLCGLPILHPLPRHLDLSKEETNRVDGLLQSIISHWSAIGNTSVQGLRESFLQREGRLTHHPDEGWLLKVEPRAYDMLLDRLPWAYTLQKLPWMKEALHVQWR